MGSEAAGGSHTVRVQVFLLSRIMGPMGADQALLDEIVHRILAVARPDRIILFGSAARGAMTKDSDIDLLVVEASADLEVALLLAHDAALAAG